MEGPLRTIGRAVGRPALLVTALLAAGCGGARLMPADGTASGDPRRPVAQKAAGALTLSVQPNAWEARPERFERAFLPLRVIVRNGSPEAVSLRAQDQVLLDDRGGRWRGVPPEEVTQQFAERGGGLRLPTVSVGASGPDPTIWNLGLGLRRERRPELADIRRLAFPDEPIAPDAARGGFFYFPLPPPGWRRLQLMLEWTGGGFGQGHTTFEFTAK